MKRLMKKYLTIVTVAQSSSLALAQPNLVGSASLASSPIVTGALVPSNQFSNSAPLPTMPYSSSLVNNNRKCIELDPGNIRETTLSGNFVVFYYDETCNSSNVFQQTVWNQLISSSSRHPSIQFARFDCLKYFKSVFCLNRSRPSVSFISGGKSLNTFEGEDFSLQKFEEFITENELKYVNGQRGMNGFNGLNTGQRSVGYGGSTRITNNNFSYKNNINNINYNKFNNAVNNYENRFSSNHVVNISNNQNWNTQVNPFGSKYRPNSMDGRNRFTPQVDALTDNQPTRRPFVGDLTDKYNQPQLVDALTDKPFGRRPSSYRNEPSNSFYNDDYPTDGLFNNVPSRSGVNNNLASFPRNTNCPQASDNCQTNPCQANPCQKKIPHECNNDCCQICYTPCPPQVKDCPKKPCPPPPINIPDINSYNEDTSPPPVYNPPKIVGTKVNTRQPDSPKMVDTKVDDTRQPDTPEDPKYSSPFQVDDITPPQSFKDAEIPFSPDVDTFRSTSPPIRDVDPYSSTSPPTRQSNKAVDAKSERRPHYLDDTFTFPTKSTPRNFQDEFIPGVDADHEEIPPLSPRNKVVPFIPSTTIPKVCNDCSNPCVEKHTCQSGNNCCCCCENSSLNINQFLKELTSNSQSHTINVINFNVNYGNCGNNC